MTRSKKILLTGALALIPMGLFADGGDHNDGCEHGDSKVHEVLMKKGFNYSFEGDLEKKPSNSINGIWKISGQEVVVNDETIIEIEDRKIKTGDELIVKAKRVGNKITALYLEQH